jgi:hypothetical protein
VDKQVRHSATSLEKLKQERALLWYSIHGDEQRKRARVYYRENRDKRLTYAKKYYAVGGKERHFAYMEKRRKYLDGYKAERGCLICGEKDPVVLDFHHTGDSPKEGNVSMMKNGSRESIDREIAKCIILCSNCHRRVTKGTVNLDDYTT